MTAYKIVGWGKYYENNRTRELKRMAWVPMPNKFDGDGYTYLVDGPTGAACFGAWCALVEVASRCDVRGTLLRTGGAPHDSESLSRITRLPEKIWNEVLPILVSIGWIERYEIPQEGAGIPQEGAGIPQEGAGIPQEGATAVRPAPHPSAMERNGTERNGKNNRRTRVRPQITAPGTSEAVEEKDDDPFDEKQAPEVVAPTEPPVPMPAAEETLKARIAEGEKSGDLAAVLMAGLELMNGHPFPSYPKEWKAAHQVEEKIRRVGKGEHPLGFLRGLLQVYLAKRKTSKQEYWRDALLSPSAINVRFDQILGSVQKIASDAQGAQIVSDFLKERQAR
jgi:hypothetical protein